MKTDGDLSDVAAEATGARGSLEGQKPEVARRILSLEPADKAWPYQL